MTSFRFEDQNLILSEQDAKVFFETLANPPKPNDAMIKAFNKYYQIKDQIMIADASNSALKGREAKKKKLPRKAKAKEKQASQFKTCKFLDSEQKIEKGRVELTLPIRTVSEANCFQPWRTKHKRHNAQKKNVFYAMLNIKHLIQLPCKIHYIRYAPTELDTFENLPMSFKYINDQVCAEITGDHKPGRADGNKNIILSCSQVKSKQYGIKIIITF